jgi:hypothetical protein
LRFFSKYQIVVIALLFTGNAFTQNLSFCGFLPAWSQTGRISSKFSYNLFISTTIDAFNVTENGIYYPATDFQLYIQPSIIYVHSTNFNITAGYVYQRNNPFTTDYINEHRIWQQAIYSHRIGKSRMSHRLRFEERFIEDRLTGQYPLATRLRYQLGFKLPLQGKTIEKNEFYFNSYNEFYLSLTGNKNATYSENWTYAGVGFNTGKAGNIELGFVFQFAIRDPQQDFRFLNMIQILWNTEFNFKKKEKKILNNF